MTNVSGTMDLPFFLPVEEAADSLETPGLNGQLARIPGVRDPIEGTVIAGILEDEGIPCVIESSGDTALGQAFAFQQSWGSVLLRLSDVEKAWTLICQMREGIELDGNDLPPELVEPEEESS